MQRFKLSTMSLLVTGFIAFSYVNAQENAKLDEINVIGNGASVQDKKLGTTVKTAKELASQQVQNSRDLVRYEPGVSVVETGRMGTSGYAIRGVDENRVAILIDGLAQAETLSSQSFKELFEGYGNFKNTRNSVEIETLKKATINKGANSLRVGSGALGGAVLFETKEAKDLLADKNYYVSYKTGYSTEDNQSLNRLSLAGRYKWFDALLIKTKRDGHELENYDYKYAENIRGKLREKSDPYTIEKESTLVKFGFSPTENHRFAISGDFYDSRSRGHDFSYNLNDSQDINVDQDALRHTKDRNKRKNITVSYENYHSTPLWDTLKFSFSRQNITNRARTDDLCTGGDCKDTRNPLGLKIADGKIVDRNGDPVSLALVPDAENKLIQQVVDKDNKPFSTVGTTNSGSFTARRVHDYWFDCELFDCTKPIPTYKFNYNTENPVKSSVQLDEFVEFNGKKFGTLKQSSTENIILPNSPGYLKNLYKKRDLNTNSKQFNLDLTKAFSLFSSEHNIEYGIAYSKIKKEMINNEGYYGTSPQWWVDRFLGKNFLGKVHTCESSPFNNWVLCPKDEPVSSFLIPVTTKNKAAYFEDNIQLNNYVSINLGYRYDKVKYQPNYKLGITPKIPDDMVKGLFVPLPRGPEISWNPGHYYDPTPEQIAQNVKENIAHITKAKKFSQQSYLVSTKIEPTDFLNIQLKYAKAFRAPTSDEIYFTFKHPDFTILPNPALEPEIGKTKELGITFYNDIGFITTSAFYTKYRNFIDLEYLGARNYTNIYGGEAKAHPFQVYQNVNRATARVKGIEIDSKLYLGEVFSPLNGFYLSYKFTYQKGKTSNQMPMNAIQPKTAVYGFGYNHKENKFGADFYITHVASKKAKDTYNLYYKESGAADSTLKWRSGSYTLFDLITYYRPIKNLTLQAGVYNLTDRKYLSWSSARSIKPFGTSNLIDQDTGQGIKRFYSPGRNFKLSAELTF